jgi:hypothetical protein
MLEGRELLNTDLNDRNQVILIRLIVAFLQLFQNK